MAAGIEEFDKFAENRKNGRAWHHMGNALPEGLTMQEAFAHEGIDWGTILAPLTADIPLPDGRTLRVPVSGNMAHFRADLVKKLDDGLAGSDANYDAVLNASKLGVVSDGYRPFENMDLARMADAISAEFKDKVSVETCGTLFNGKRIFGLLRFNETIEVLEGDPLQQYLLLGNGHGGFAALTGYSTDIRVVCSNTLRWSERDLARGFRMQHTGDFDQKLKQAKTLLGLAFKENKRFETQVKALIKCNLSVGASKQFMLDIYEECFGVLPSPDADEQTYTKAVYKRDKIINRWIENLEDEANTIKGMVGTAWQTLNAITQWHDHERGRAGPGTDARIHSNLYGISHKHKLKTLRAALALTQ